MSQILREKIRIAKKQYDCDASEWFNCQDTPAIIADDFEFSYADKRKLVKIRSENFKINAGDKYLEQVGIVDGEFYYIKCRLDVVELLNKYQINQES